MEAGGVLVGSRVAACFESRSKLANFCRGGRSTSDCIVVARQNFVVGLSCHYKKIVDFAMICRGCDLFGRAQVRALLSRARCLV